MYTSGDHETLRDLRRAYQAASRLDAVIETLLAQLVHARCHAESATAFGDDGRKNPAPA